MGEGGLLVREGEDYSIHLISKGELTLPPWNPLCSKPGLSVPLGGRGPGAQWAPPRTDRGGSRDRSPLKNFILEKDFPLPYPKGTDYISPALREGAGGGPLPSRQGRDGGPAGPDRKGFLRRGRGEETKFRRAEPRGIFLSRAVTRLLTNAPLRAMLGASETQRSGRMLV